MDTTERDRQIKELRAQGLPYRAISARAGVSAMQCQRICTRGEPRRSRVSAEDAVEEEVLRVLVADCMRPDGSVDRESALWRLVFPTDPGLLRAQHRYALKRFAEEQYMEA